MPLEAPRFCFPVERGGEGVGSQGSWPRGGGGLGVERGCGLGNSELR